jgi:hypothetical protein
VTVRWIVLAIAAVPVVLVLAIGRFHHVDAPEQTRRLNEALWQRVVLVVLCLPRVVAPVLAFTGSSLGDSLFAALATLVGGLSVAFLAAGVAWFVRRPARVAGADRG